MPESRRIDKDNNSKPDALPPYLRVSNILVRFLFLWTVFGVIVLSFRVLLLAFSANPATRFVNFVYDTSNRYLEPFRGIFHSRTVGETGYLDISAMFAVIVYLLFLWGILALIDFVERKIQETKYQTSLERTRPNNNRVKD